MKCKIQILPSSRNCDKNTVTKIDFKFYIAINANDSKTIRLIEDESSAKSLQRDINSVTNWTKE